MQNTEFITKSSAFDMPRKLLFIVNPNAGKKIWEEIITIIRKEFPENIAYQIVIWKDKHHFEEITALLKTEGYTDAIAVGGDGTVNQVAQAIVNTNIALGIVPVGSGNGLARSLGLSMKINEVIKQIAKGKTEVIDCGTVNNRFFFCTSGIGFDAHIGNLFASSKKRGLQSYVNITVRELLRYRAKNYTLTFNNQTIQRKAFLITVANAGQYGNNFYIAPQANLQDGKFHVAILKPFNVISVFGILTKILRRKAHLSRNIETYVTDKITITRNNKDSIHFDGEPAFEEKEVVFEIKPQALKVIVGGKFQVQTR
ncbi:MAG: diacylglycerol kinase family lipid kinase [Bacteroidetes bacterium]|nr:diacylglycerol kinase family lipid kinase [Bacteroidota bacterium]